MMTVSSLRARFCNFDPSTLAPWLWKGLTKGFGGKRVGRYFRLGFAGLALIWMLTAAYLFLTPRSYESAFTLILPGAGSGASLSLNAIGQASSLSESAFSNTRVSPTESYKRLILSDRVFNAAKREVGRDWFPKPRISLLDQTQFMTVAVNAATPDEALAFAQSLNTAFLTEVSQLRIEEQGAREAGYQQRLAEFERSVSQARLAILEHQAQSGLASLDQYRERVAKTDQLEAELNAAPIVAAEMRQRLLVLLDLLRITESDAAAGLRFAADPVFMNLATQYADLQTDLAKASLKFNTEHPKYKQMQRENAGLVAQLTARGKRFGNIAQDLTLEVATRIGDVEYASILKEVVHTKASLEAAQARTRALATAVSKEKEKIRSLSRDAAKLDELNRAHQVADAVFLSAMARIETGKTDLFASYPLIQTVEPPLLADKPSSPIPLLGIIGAVVASIFYIMGLILLCLRLPLLRVISKNL